MTISNFRFPTFFVSIAVLFTLLACDTVTGPDPTSSDEVTFFFEADESAQASSAKMDDGKKAGDLVRTGRFRVEGAVQDAGTYQEVRVESAASEFKRTMYGWRQLKGSSGTVVFDCRACLIRGGVLTEGILHVANATGPYADLIGSETAFDVTTRTDPGSISEIHVRRVR